MRARMEIPIPLHTFLEELLNLNIDLFANALRGYTIIIFTTWTLQIFLCSDQQTLTILSSSLQIMILTMTYFSCIVQTNPLVYLFPKSLNPSTSIPKFLQNNLNLYFFGPRMYLTQLLLYLIVSLCISFLSFPFKPTLCCFPLLYSPEVFPLPIGWVLYTQFSDRPLIPISRDWNDAQSFVPYFEKPFLVFVKTSPKIDHFFFPFRNTRFSKFLPASVFLEYKTDFPFQLFSFTSKFFCILTSSAQRWADMGFLQQLLRSRQKVMLIIDSLVLLLFVR